MDDANENDARRGLLLVAGRGAFHLHTAGRGPTNWPRFRGAPMARHFVRQRQFPIKLDEKGTGQSCGRPDHARLGEGRRRRFGATAAFLERGPHLDEEASGRLVASTFNDGPGGRIGFASWPGTDGHENTPKNTLRLSTARDRRARGRVYAVLWDGAGLGPCTTRTSRGKPVVEARDLGLVCRRARTGAATSSRLRRPAHLNPGPGTQYKTTGGRRFRVPGETAQVVRLERPTGAKTVWKGAGGDVSSASSPRRSAPGDRTALPRAGRGQTGPG